MSLPIVILAGGLATRLGEISRTTPKALLPVAGEPFIFHQLRLLRRHGLTEVVICAAHLGDQIQARVGNGLAHGLTIHYVFDGPELLGTGGAIKKALPLLGEKFLVMYGDSYLRVDYEAVSRTFLDSGRAALMTVYQNEGQYDTSNVIFENGKILVYDKKNKNPKMEYIDYGLGGLTAETVFNWPAAKFDLADIYADLAGRGDLAGYEVEERFYEIGSPAGLAELDVLLSRQDGRLS